MKKIDRRGEKHFLLGHIAYIRTYIYLLSRLGIRVPKLINDSSLSRVIFARSIVLARRRFGFFHRAAYTLECQTRIINYRGQADERSMRMS